MEKKANEMLVPSPAGINLRNGFGKVNKLDRKYGREHFDRIKEKSSYKDKKEYLKAVRMNTLSGRHHYILGLAYLIKGDKELAEEHFNKAKEFGYKK